MNTTITQRLAVHVADVQVMYVKLHNYHWHVKGLNFKPIHEFTEALYDELAEQYDELAERMLMLGAKPPVTMKDYLAMSAITEEPGTDHSTQDVLKGIQKDFTYLLNEVKETRKIAADAEDAGTDALLSDLIASLEKHLWMIKASLS